MMLTTNLFGPRVHCEFCRTRIGPDYGSERQMGVVAYIHDPYIPYRPDEPAQTVAHFLHAGCVDAYTASEPDARWVTTGLLDWLARLIVDALGYEPGDLRWPLRQRAEEAQIEAMIDAAREEAMAASTAPVVFDLELEERPF